MRGECWRRWADEHRDSCEGMKSHYRDILKHSGVYGLGQVLSRLASVLMLPLYTHFLRPADYGTIAILDLTAGVVGIIIGGGMVSAVSRYHFDTDAVDEQNAVWWTGLTVVITLCTLAVAPAFLFRASLARLTLGADLARGPYFYALMLPTLWFVTVSQIPDQYMRIRKWSWLTVAVSLGGLIFNIALNIYFVAALGMGVAGVLWGNLTTGIVTGVVRIVFMARATGWPTFRWPVAEQLWRFGSPMVVAGLLALVMHQADRYVLRLFRDLGEVGLYSLAYTVGQGVYGVFTIPFQAIWGVVVYEIAKQPDAKRAYARIFQYYMYALMLFMFGVSLFVRPVFAEFLPAEYMAAVPLVPIVCLAFVFPSAHEHFRVPALLAKQTTSLLLAFATGAVANVVLNLLVVPTYGAVGAAWTSVATYAIFSGVGLVRYRQFDRYEYPLLRCAVVLLAMIASFVACERVIDGIGVSRIAAVGVPAVVWLGWAAALLSPLLKEQLFQRTPATAS
jgi:O-antigen/teichoic acid export membrane protein